MPFWLKLSWLRFFIISWHWHIKGQKRQNIEISICSGLPCCVHRGSLRPGRLGGIHQAYLWDRNPDCRWRLAGYQPQENPDRYWQEGLQRPPLEGKSSKDSIYYLIFTLLLYYKHDWRLHLSRMCGVRKWSILLLLDITYRCLSNRKWAFSRCNLPSH